MNESKFASPDNDVLGKSVEAKVLENMRDGVIWTEDKGTIVYMNDAAQKMLDLQDAEVAGEKFASVFIDKPENDDFTQAFIDSLGRKGDSNEVESDFVTAAGKTSHLQISNTYMEDGEKKGILSVITDITEKTKLLQQKTESTHIIAFFFIFISVFLLLYRFFQDYYPWLGTAYLSRTVEYGALLCSVVLFRKTCVWEFENRVKCKKPWEAIRSGITLSAIGTAILILVKVIFISRFPQNKSFFDFSYFDIGTILFAVNVFAQEFVARCVMFDSISRVFSGKHATLLAVITTSLLFAVFHVHHSLVYMVLAGIMMGTLCIYYVKTKNIWSVFIVHYVLGQMIVILSYVTS